MTDPYSHLRIFIPEVVGITYNGKDNTWLVMPAEGFNFSKADSRCKTCLGQGRSGYADITWKDKPGKIIVICPKCYGRMKLPEAETPRRPGWITRLFAWCSGKLRRRAA